MKVILFQPFDLVKWLVIGFTAWLARFMEGGNGGGDPRFDLDKRGPAEVVRDFSHDVDRFVEQLVWAPLVLFAVLLIIAIIVLIVWLSSRMKFVFLDNVIRNRAAVIEPWQRLKRQGDSLFLWRICFGLACIAVAVVIVVLTVGPLVFLAASDTWHSVGVLGLVLFGLLMIVFAFVALYISMFVEHFVIPIMYGFKLTAVAAWRVFMPWLTSYSLTFFAYGLWAALLFVLALVAVFLTCCCCCLALLPYVGTVVLLPLWVTYRLMSVEFLAQFDPKFDLFSQIEAEQNQLVPQE
jgi:hypothetical protein